MMNSPDGEEKEKETKWERKPGEKADLNIANRRSLPFVKSEGIAISGFLSYWFWICALCIEHDALRFEKLRHFRPVWFYILIYLRAENSFVALQQPRRPRLQITY